MALVRDPYFWKRFSTAVHMDEESKAVDPGTPNKEDQNSWLFRERQKRKRSLIWGFIIFFAVILIVILAVIMWWLAKNNWLQPRPDTTA